MKEAKNLLEMIVSKGEEIYKVGLDSSPVLLIFVPLLCPTEEEELMIIFITDVTSENKSRTLLP